MSKVTLSAVKRSFCAYWWLYIVVVVLVCAAVLYGFYLVDKVRDNEKIQIFVAGEVFDLSVAERMQNLLKNDGILDVNLYRLESSFKGFATGFSAQGFLNSDILLLPESLLDDYYGYALVLDGVIALPDGCTTYAVDGKTYAIKVADVDDGKFTALYGFEWLAESDEDMYVLLSPQSVNIGAFNKSANPSDKQAIRLLTALLLGEI